MENFRIYITGLLFAAVLAPVNYLAHTPLIYIVSVAGIAAFMYAAKKLKEQFDVPLIFVRKDGVNYWSSAFGGLVGGVTGFYGSTQGLNGIALPELFADIGLITVLLVLGTTLLMGAVMQDIQDGYFEISEQ